PAGRRDFAEVPFQAAGFGDEPAAGVDGFQLRIEFRRAVAFGLRDAPARCDYRRRHALYTSGYGGSELERGRAHSERVEIDEIRISELSRGNVGAGGCRRNAGPPRA